MGDEYEGGPRLVGELAEEAEDVFAVGGIEIAGGLIGQNERGAVDEGAGDGDALLFAAGKLRGQGGGARGEADAREGDRDAGGALGSGDAGELERELDVFGGGEGGEQMEKLEHGADALAAEAGEPIARECVDALAVEGDGASVGAIDAAEAIEERGLAAAGGPGQRDAFAGGNGERHIGEHGACAVGFADGGYGQNGSDGKCRCGRCEDHVAKQGPLHGKASGGSGNAGKEVGLGEGRKMPGEELTRALVAESRTVLVALDVQDPPRCRKARCRA